MKTLSSSQGFFIFRKLEFTNPFFLTRLELDE